MAFISMREFSSLKPGRDSDKPNVIFRLAKSGSTNGRFNKACPFHGKRVDIQIDEETKRIRIRQDDSGVSVHEKSGQFGLSVRVVKIVGTKKIYISALEDGWWYGSYENTEDSCTN